jgi:hypothetical protein
MATENFKGTQGEAIAQMIREELFNEDNIAPCGPCHMENNPSHTVDVPANSYKQSFNKIDKGVDRYSHNYNYIPHETYRPQVTIAFDFTDMFVAAVRKEAADNYSLTPRRLIDETILMQRARDILKFVKYYFEYTNSYKTYKTYDTAGKKTKEALEYENLSEFEIRGEGDANKLLNETFNMFMTSISVTRSRGDIGTATINFKNVRNYFNGKSVGPLYDYSVGMLRDLLVPMIPVKLWARGRFYNQWFFPIFDGYIVSTSVKDAEGFAELEITCKDVLEIARFTTEMINPALINIAELRKVDALNLQSMPFYGHDHMELVKTLLKGGKLEYDPTGAATNVSNNLDPYGNVKKGFTWLNGVGLVPTDQVANRIKLQAKKSWGGILSVEKKLDVDKVKAAAKKEGITPTLNLLQIEEFDWYSNLDAPSVGLFDGMLEQGPIKEEEFTTDRRIKEVSHAETKRKILAWGSRITPYRIWETQTPETFSATFASRLEILQEVAKNVYYDLYVDGAGNVQYHPYRFINDYLFNDAIYLPPNQNSLHPHPVVWPGVYVIAPEESTNHNEQVNFEELVTFLKLRGQDPWVNIESDLGGIFGGAIHKDYLERFGYRRALEQNPLFNINFPLDNSASSVTEASVTFMDLAAASLIIYRNGSLHTKESTVIFRPELDVAKPIYYPEDDMVFYIDSISHSITIGGDATTTISASYGRKIYEKPVDLQSFVLMQEGLWKYGAQNIDAESFIRQLPVTEWQNFLNTNQKDTLALAQFQAEQNKRPQEAANESLDFIEKYPSVDVDKKKIDELFSYK